MKHKSAVLSLFLCFVMLFLALIPVFAQDATEPGRYLIEIPADKKLILRKAPSSGAEPIDYLYNGETVEVVEVNNGWIKVQQNGRFGWCSAKYASLLQKYECAISIADISTADCSAVDFAVLKQNGVQGVLLRLGVSANTASIIAADLNYENFYRAAKKAGLYIGFYFSSSAINSAQVIKEYEWVLQKLEAFGMQPDLPVFYRPTTSDQKNLSSSENTLLVSLFCEQLEKRGIEAGVYLPADWTSKNLNFDELGEYAHWIADFGDYCNFTKSYDIWQYRLAEEADGITGKAGFSYMFTDLIAKHPTVPTDSTVTEPPVSDTEPNVTESKPPQTDVPEPGEREPDHVHAEGEFTVTTQPGCSSCGMESAFCTVCGALMHTRLIAPVGHRDAAEWECEKEPTETEHGCYIRRCTVCNAVTKMQDVSPLSDGHIHVLADWEYIDTAAEYDAIPCVADREKVLKCVDCGLITAKYKDTPESHIAEQKQNVTNADCEKEGHDQTVCKLCGIVTEDIITPAYGHDVKNWTVTKEPTDTEIGEQQGACAVCGKTVTREIAVLSGIPGDVNGDGKVTSSDARTVLRVSARLEALTDSAAKLRADMNGDGNINSADARLILRKAAKLD